MRCIGVMTMPKRALADKAAVSDKSAVGGTEREGGSGRYGTVLLLPLSLSLCVRACVRACSAFKYIGTEQVIDKVKEKGGNQAVGWWKSPGFWGACGAAAGWGMSGSAIYDAQFQGPEVRC